MSGDQPSPYLGNCNHK